MRANLSIDTDPQQQAAASPPMLVVRSFLRYMHGGEVHESRRRSHEERRRQGLHHAASIGRGAAKTRAPVGRSLLGRGSGLSHGLGARVRRAGRRAPMSFTRRDFEGKLRVGAPACLALSGNSYNWSANTEQQLQEAASPQRLLPGCLQRCTASLAGPAACRVNSIPRLR
jgi:hypothetical protein